MSCIIAETHIQSDWRMKMMGYVYSPEKKSELIIMVVSYDRSHFTDH